MIGNSLVSGIWPALNRHCSLPVWTRNHSWEESKAGNTLFGYLLLFPMQRITCFKCNLWTCFASDSPINLSMYHTVILAFICAAERFSHPFCKGKKLMAHKALKVVPTFACFMSWWSTSSMCVKTMACSDSWTKKIFYRQWTSIYSLCFL